MNTGADPVGYKQMSRQLAGLREAGGDTVELMEGNQQFLKIAAYSLLLLAVIALFAALQAARFIAIPVVAGLVVGLIIGPVGDRGRQVGVPKSVTYSLLVLSILSVMALCVWLVLPVVELIVSSLPRASERLQGLLAFIGDWVRAFENLRSGGEPVPSPAATVGAPRTSTVEIATTAVALVSPAMSQAVIFAFSLVLFLVGRSHWRSTLVMLFTEREHRLHALKSLSAVENILTNYFIVVTGINLGLATVVAALFWLAGIPGAFSWAVLAFILNFLPVVGPLFLKLALLAFGFLVYPDPVHALLPLGLFLSVSLIEANLITPKIVGDRITMDPLTVFLSVVFFTWLWGFAGAFLAMPLLAIASVALAREETAPRLPA